MSIGGRYFSELEPVLMLGFWVGVPVFFLLFLFLTFAVRGRWRAVSALLLAVQVAIPVGEMTASKATAQFWRWVLLLDVALAPLLAATLVGVTLASRVRKTGDSNPA